MPEFIKARIKSANDYLENRDFRLSVNELRHHPKGEYLAARFVLSKEADQKTSLPVHEVSVEQTIRLHSISNEADGISIIRYSLLYSLGMRELIKHTIIDADGFLPGKTAHCRTTDGLELPIAEGYLCELQGQPDYRHLSGVTDSVPAKT